jgi:flagellar P-ring protein precursor FlgI
MIRLAIAFLACLLAVHPAAAQRVKDLGGFQGIRSNQLTGYGMVVGLPGTGDDNLEYTVQSMKSVASRFGLQLPQGVAPGLKNAAVVMITADLPPFAKPGQKLDITVSSMGKAKSLRGGTLIMTPLQGADGQIYAMAQAAPTARRSSSTSPPPAASPRVRRSSARSIPASTSHRC